MTCPDDNCNFLISNSVFKSNSASKQGGAINFNDVVPELWNLTFENNSAPYGHDVSSYINDIETNITDIVLTPGQTDETKITFQILDKLGKLITNDFTSNMVLEFIYGGNYTFVGDNSKLVVGGKVTFDSLLF